MTFRAFPSTPAPRRAARAAKLRTEALAAVFAALVCAGTAHAQTGDAATPWAAAASGRVEPRGGDIRIGTSLLGRVAEVLVSVNDKVEAGELVIRLDDEEARARLSAAEAQAGAARSERDSQSLSSAREDVRKAEDAVYAAERALTGARFDLDYALSAKRGGTADDATVADARRRVTEANDRFLKERLAFATAQSKSGLPAPSRAESATSTARAEVAIAQALLDKTRVRAPAAGTVLQMNATIGDVVAPSPDQPLAVLGDMSLLRVKAEVDEGDVSKIKTGQKVIVRNASYPGKEFEGKVSKFAPSLAPPRLTGRGPRRPSDVDVLDVTIDLTGTTPLLPGMRVDAFFQKD